MSFISKFLNDADKSVNPAWVVTGFIAVAVVAWGCWEAYHTHAMPSRLLDAAGLIGSSAGLNIGHKAEAIVDKFKGNGDQPKPPVVSRTEGLPQENGRSGIALG